MIPEVIKIMVKDLSKWWADEVPTRMDKLRSMLYTKGNKPYVIYIHWYPTVCRSPLTVVARQEQIELGR